MAAIELVEGCTPVQEEGLPNALQVVEAPVTQGCLLHDALLRERAAASKDLIVITGVLSKPRWCAHNRDRDNVRSGTIYIGILAPNTN